MEESKARGSNFIWDIIEEDLRQGKLRPDQVHTRFPPEPNGYLHIGHCKAIYINFTTAGRYGGLCNLRFDDTNPTKEDVEYVDAIQEDIRWLGYDWNGGLFFASDYFPKMYQLAEKLIQDGQAFVDDQTAEEIRATRGTLTQPGTESPYRNRSIEENLDLFRRMRAGEFPDGSRVLRGKIDMASPNINLRDPVLYRIVHASHHRTGDDWCIYPMYDFAHSIEDSLEGITHSLCSIEFENHRPLYDWVNIYCGFDPRPRQIEFARLNMTRTVMSKRYLRGLVETGVVSGWDDPRMPTIAAMRRRGYPAPAILDFVERAGISKADSVVDMQLLEHCVREWLGEQAPRAMAVLDPIKVRLTNWPEDKVEMLEVENHPGHPEMGTRQIPFGHELYIEREDFSMNPPKKFFRMFLGGEVRLKGAYIIRCDDVILDCDDQVYELRCTVDLDSKSGSPGAERKVKGTLHWVAADCAVPVEARLYEPLLRDEAETAVDAEQETDEGGAPETQNDKKDFTSQLNPDSLQIRRGFMEPYLDTAAVGGRFQFLRVGYFAKDPDSTPELAVFNRIVSLKDSWAKNIGNR